MSEPRPHDAAPQIPPQQGHTPPPAPQPGQPYSQPGQPYAQPGQPHAQPGQPHAQPGQPHAQPGQPYAQPGQPYSQPGQPYTQPGQPHAQPGQPYAQPGQPYRTSAASGTPYGASSSAAGNPLGRLAFVVTVVSVAVGLVWQLLLPMLYASVGFGVMGALQSVPSFLVLVGAATGLVLGITALRRPAPHLLAAIAVGIAANTVIGTVVSFVASLFYSLGF
ncbi:hypothetical protein J3D45_000544 [Microbacterium foliorum]|uniref:hypothetical protein n=1 Tax=Microbacterium foliorum TaxID=104336 RepID=UPI0020A0726B|nr:hypothetical protein [Microbacterium foliorum]MCP1428046.1 hypothetical protein [Microbacterium foliorum]